jgi:proton glutamate symport protein
VKLPTRIFIGLVAGIGVGAASKLPAADHLNHALIAIEPLGTAFIRLITMTIVPLVVASLFVGVASLGDVRRLGRVGGKAVAYFAATTVIAATIGLGLALAAQLGREIDATTRDALLRQAPVIVADRAAAMPSLGQTLVNMIPQNPFAAAAQGDLLPLIVAVCIFAAAASVITGDGRRAVIAFFQGVNDLSMVVIRWLMWLAPAAVFVLVAATVARSGSSLLASLLLYALVAVGAMAVHVVLILLPALRFGARLGVRHFVRATSDALLMAFSTASSNATLPVSMTAATDRLGVPAEITSFVLPAGATLNKNGAAVYKTVTAVFIAQLYGIPLGLGQLVTIVLTATLAASAGAGVPGSSLVTTLIVLNAIGLGPQAAAGIALVAGIDRPLDMCRTTVNTIGNLIGAAWIARSEGIALRIVPANEADRGASAAA